MSKKKKVAILLASLFGIGLLLICCVVFFVILIGASSDGSFSEGTVIKDGTSEGKVAVIDINEVISSVGSSDFFGNEFESMAEELTDKINAATEDDTIKGVILRVDTPGGEVYATKLIYDEIVELQQQKPVVVMMGGIAASGGYYIAAPADHILAEPITITGSIGVVLTQYDYAGLYEKVGIEEITITNTDGKFKRLNDLQDENGEGYKLFQSLLDDIQADFVNVVKNGRGYTDAQVKAVADGRVFSGKQALNNGLIDGLGGFEEAQIVMSELTGVEDPSYVVFEEPVEGFSPYGFSLRNLIFGEQSILDQAAKGPELYYLLK